MIIDTRDTTPQTRISNPKSTAVLLETRNHNHSLLSKLFAVASESDEVSELIGEVIVFPSGISKGINLYTLEDDLVIVMNIAMYLVVALWLALRSHRRVLDYFSKSGSLQPLVAACGKGEFYGAIWVITLSRVMLFLGSTLPISAIMFFSMQKSGNLHTSISLSYDSLILWFLCLFASLSLVTIVGSISELKQRHGIAYFAYKVLPIACSLFGAVFWTLSLFSSDDVIISLRSLIISCPVFGLLPIIGSPIVGVSNNLIVFHTWLSAILIILILASNSRWFAAHLEEL